MQLVVQVAILHLTLTINLVKHRSSHHHHHTKSKLNITTNKDAFMKCMLLFKKYSDIGVDEYEMQIPVEKLELFGKKGIIPYM